MEVCMDNIKKLNTSILIIILLVLLLLFNSYRNSSKINNIEYRLNDLSMSMNNQTNNLYNNFSNLENQMIQSISDLQSYNFTFQGLDIKNNTVKLNFTFSLKQIQTNAEYYISYSPVEQNNFKEVKANNITGTSFENLLDLSTAYNYNFKIIEKSENGTIKQLNNQDIYNDVLNLYGNRTQLQALDVFEYGNILSYHIFLTNNTLGMEENEVKSVVLSLYYQDNIVYSEDITNKNTMIQDGESSIISGATASATVHVYDGNQDSTIINKDALQEYNFQIDISKDDLKANYPEIFKDVKDYKNLLNHKIIIELQSGDKIEF